ncbi:lipopolysaccharide biosynthesis protein [Rhodococcus sp. IEGM 1307]|uniref:lipopolysaccharide biosynthesis protein n=1 Tax=Rhodococcus sp. IEGM 1307 TaxID=3047091 RepID=UPI0024B81C62|nr:lipopolysaccharide biosynthesis protein [Rhodococcus sp. IEGM 1307]MDI9976087.1 lipopolysaccharide biosynthesis protein [Rhodococcus sp. IEGM 1307]
MSVDSSAVTRHSVIYVAASILQKLSSLILLPVYTRLLTPEEYGYFNLIITLLLLGGAVATLGLEFAVARYCHPEISDDVTDTRDWKLGDSQGRYYTAAYFVVVAASMGVTALLAATGPLYSPIAFPDFDFYPVVLIALVSILFQPLTAIYLSLLQARSMARAYGTFSLALFLSNALLTVALLGPLDLGLLGVAVSLVAVNAFFALLGTLRASRLGMLWIRFCADDVRRILSYSLPMLPHTLTLQATSLASRVIISNLVSVAAAGLFNIAMYAVNFIDAVQTALHRAFLPWYFTQVEQQTVGWQDNVRDVIAAFVGASVVVSSAVALFASELLVVMTPESFHEAANIVPILALSMMVKSVYYPSLSALLYNERGTNLVMVISGTASVFSIPLAVAGAFSLGLTGVALAQLMQRLVMSAMAVRLSARVDRPPIPWGSVMRLQAGGVTVVVLVMIGDHAAWWGLGFWWLLVAKSAVGIALASYLFVCDPNLFRAARRVLSHGR